METEKIKESGLISIKPYVRETPSSLGLEEYNMTIFPKTKHSEPLAYIVIGDKRKYITGLDEQAASIKSIADPKRKAAKILEIRKTVALLEQMHNQNNIDDKIESADFWNHVETFRSDNAEFFGKIRLDYTNEENYLFPANNVLDLVIFHAVKAGGFSMCGSDQAVAEKSQLRWFLSVEKEETAINISISRNKNQMIAKLEAIFEEGNNNLFYLCKYLVADAVSYRKTTTKELLYDSLNLYLNGKKQIKRVEEAVKNFKNATDMTTTELQTYAMAKDLMANNKVTVSPSGIKNKETGNHLGSTLHEFAQHLANPTNQQETEHFMEVLEQDCW